MAGALQMIAVAPPLILLLMWLGQPGLSAALLGTAAAMSSTALVSRQLADQASSPPATDAVPSPCWSFRTLASVPCWPCWRSGRAGSRRRSSIRCSKYSVCCCCSRQRPSSLAPSVVRQPAGLEWRAGPRIVRARLCLCVVVAAAPLLHAVGVSAATGAFPPPGWCWARATSGTTLESHLRPFRDVLSGVFFVTIGLQPDAAQILSAPLAVLAWLVVLVPVKILLNTLALRATRLSALDARRTA